MVAGQDGAGRATAQPGADRRQPVRPSAHRMGPDRAGTDRARCRSVRRGEGVFRGGRLLGRRLRRRAGARGGVSTRLRRPHGGGHRRRPAGLRCGGGLGAEHAARAPRAIAGDAGGGAGRGGRLSGSIGGARRPRRPPDAGRLRPGRMRHPGGVRRGARGLRHGRHRRRRRRPRSRARPRPAAHAAALPDVAAGGTRDGGRDDHLRPPGRRTVREAARRPGAARIHGRSRGHPGDRVGAAARGVRGLAGARVPTGPRRLPRRRRGAAPQPLAHVASAGGPAARKASAPIRRRCRGPRRPAAPPSSPATATWAACSTKSRNCGRG